MTYRSYPDATRARRQLDRHNGETAPLSDGATSVAGYAMPRLVISDKARTAMSVRLAEVGASLRSAFQRPAGSEARRQLLPKSWEHGRNLPCDDHCVCPVHGTPLMYWPAGDEHACQDVNCQYGHGMKPKGAGSVRPDEEPTE